MSIVDRYISKGIKIFPVQQNKSPAIPKEVISWKDIENSGDFRNYFKNENIALITGKKNNVVVVDIDTEIPEVKKAIAELMKNYPTPIERLGNRNRLPSRFYAYNGEASRAVTINGAKIVELISDGRYCVIPPSMRDDGCRFEWVGSDSLLNFNIDYLPHLPNDIIPKIEEAIKPFIHLIKEEIKKRESQGLGTGRNSKIFEMMSAMVGDGKSCDEAIEEVFEYDKNNHRPPWLEDESEPHRGDKKRATKYLVEMYNRILGKEIENHGVPEDIGKIELNIVENNQEINLEEEKEETKRKQLPRLLGIGQKMFEYLYSMSATPKSHQIFSYIMSLSSTLMANRYQLEGTFSNTFTLVFSESGAGKNEGQDFITALFEQADMSNLIGERLPGGSTAMLMNLPNYRERIDIVSEGTRFFEAMSSSKEYKSEMALIYSDLFNAGGKGFYNKSNQQEKKDNKNNKQGRIGECFSPCVTLLVTINMNSSKMLILDKSYEQGFMARMNVRLDSDRKKRKPYGGSIVDNIPYEFVSFVKGAGPVKRTYKNEVENTGTYDLNTSVPMAKFIVPEIPISDEAKKRMKEIECEIIEMEYATDSEDKMVYVIRRAYENFKKSILCIVPLHSSRLGDLKVELKDVEWAWELTKVDLNNHRLYLEKYQINSKKEDNMMTIYKLVKRLKNAKKGDIYKAVRDKKERDEALHDLKECGYLLETREGKAYCYTINKKW